MRKQQLLVTASCIALLSGAASVQAADLGRMNTKAPALAASPYDVGWTGFYVGGQVGYAWGTVNDAGTAFNGEGGVGIGGRFDGIVGGGHVGYNYQAGPVIWGLEGDIEGSGVRGASFDQRWQSSIRGRVGWSPVSSLMIYATGGAAFSEFHNNGLIAGFNTGLSDTVSRTGYTVGGGLEYKFAPNFSTRVEYRYTDFGKVTDAGSDARIESSTVRVGLSYYFSAGAPVVAAY